MHIINNMLLHFWQVLLSTDKLKNPGLQHKSKIQLDTNNFIGKKNRIYLSTLLTAYHYYQRIFKEEREIKKYNYG